MNHEKRRISGMLSSVFRSKNVCTKNEKVTFNLKHILLYVYNFHVKTCQIWDLYRRISIITVTDTWNLIKDDS